MLALGLFVSVAPWGFFAALAVLLGFGRPRTAREWLWLGLALIWTVSLWSQSGGTLLYYAVNAWGALLAGAFALVAFGRTPQATPASWIATAVAGIVFVLLLHAFGYDLGAVEFDATRMLTLAQGDMRAIALQVFGTAPAPDPGAPAAVAALTPALFSILGALGLDLAWRWYHRIATVPLGAPPRPFAEFRFSDHLVWILVAAFATVLAQSSGFLASSVGPANVLLVMTVLYAARGLAVLWPALHKLPGITRVAIVVMAVVLLVFVVAGLFGIGLADTWVDFRRRKAAAQGG